MFKSRLLHKWADCSNCIYIFKNPRSKFYLAFELFEPFDILNSVEVMWGGRTHIGRPAPYENTPCVVAVAVGLTTPAPFNMAVGTMETAGVAGLTTRPPTHLIF